MNPTFFDKFSVKEILSQETGKCVIHQIIFKHNLPMHFVIKIQILRLTNSQISYKHQHASSLKTNVKAQ